MIQYRDLSVSWLERRKYLSSINEILKTGKIIDGKQIEELEKEVATYCGRDYAIAVNSGTSAIFLALQVLGIKKNDEVIVPCIGVVPVVNPILMLEAKPVFVDVKEDYNINSDLIEKKITKRTKAILAVDYTGRVCDFDSLKAIAKFHKLFLIEDASQAFGAKYLGKKAGSFGDISVMSMNAMKVLGTTGEAGMILTDSAYLDEELRKRRYNGLIDKVISDYVSLNFRMNTIQASILLHKMKNIDKNIVFRQEIAHLYDVLLGGEYNIPKPADLNDIPSYFTYNIRVDNRDALYENLKCNLIETQKRDSIILPHQLKCRNSYSKLKFVVGDEIAKTSISLPMHDKLTREDVYHICERIRMFYGR